MYKSADTSIFYKHFSRKCLHKTENKLETLLRPLLLVTYAFSVTRSRIYFSIKMLQEF
jgi:hypothetical protein